MTEHNGKPVACYMRVSTRDQDLSLQRAALTRYCETHRLQPLWFEDHGTGANTRRPGWEACWQSLQRGETDTLVAWKLDRVGRSLIDLVQIAEEVIRRKRHLITLDGISLDGPMSKLIYNVLAAVAEYEREQIRERVTAGLAAAKANGRQIGGSAKGHGSYRYARKGTKKHAQYQRILSGFQTGLSLADVVADSGVCERTVCRIKKQLKEEGVL